MDFTKYIKRQTRQDGSSYVAKTDDCPQVLSDLIYKIHDDDFYNSLPNDWIYENIRYALICLHESHIDDVNIESDCYNSDLYTWLGNPYADSFIEEAIEEGLTDSRLTSIWGFIGCGQFLAKQRIYHRVSEFIEEQERLAD